MENELFLARYYWTQLWYRPLRWLLPMIAVFAIGTFIILQSPREYMSTARVAVQSTEATSTLVQSTVTSERIQFFEQRVLSRNNLVAIADKLDLFPGLRQSYSEGQIAELLRRQIAVQEIPTEPSTLNMPTTPSSNSAILTISFKAGSAEVAAAGASEVVQLFIAESRNIRITEASQMRTFLEQEVTSRRGQADALNQEWLAFVSENEALLPNRLPLYTMELNELQQELQTIQIADASLAADTRVLESQLAATTLPSGAESQLAALRQELATKLTRFSETHPDIISLRARIETLEANLEQMAAASDASSGEQITAQSAESAILSGRVVSARQQQQDYAERRTQINERLAYLRSRIAQMPSVEASLAALQRRQTTAEENLADMQGRLDTALVSERLENARQDSQISVIDEPEVPAFPSGTGRTQLLLILGVLAAGAGLCCVIALDLTNRSIKSRRDLLPILEGANLALIPEWKPKRKHLFAKASAAAILLAMTGSIGGALVAPSNEILTIQSQTMVWKS